MEFLPALKILMETGSSGKSTARKRRGGITGPSNCKVESQELLMTGSAVIKNSLTLRSAFLCVGFILRLLIETVRLPRGNGIFSLPNSGMKVLDL